MSISLDPPLFLTIPDAAKRIGVDPRRLKAAIDTNQIPSLKVGKQLLISRLVLERLAAEGKQYEP